MNYLLGQLEQQDRYVAYDFFVYEEDFSDLESGASQQGSINITAEADFVCQKLCYFADLSGAAQTDSSRIVPLISVQIIDAGSGRNLLESPAPVPSIFGQGNLPFILPRPRVFFQRSTVEVTVANFSDDQTYDLRLSFIGYKAYPRT